MRSQHLPIQQPKQTALSIKQPWAALVLAGLKTIEIRRWPTARRGRILIHAAGVPDTRVEGWRLLTPAMEPLSQRQGGIIGSVTLTGCKHYTELDLFKAEQTLHRNDPSWFEPKGMYGFVFTEPEILVFRKYPGWFRFFSVDVAADLQTLVATS